MLHRIIAHPSSTYPSRSACLSSQTPTCQILAYLTVNVTERACGVYYARSKNVEASIYTTINSWSGRPCFDLFPLEIYEIPNPIYKYKRQDSFFAPYGTKNHISPDSFTRSGVYLLRRAYNAYLPCFFDNSPISFLFKSNMIHMWAPHKFFCRHISRCMLDPTG